MISHGEVGEKQSKKKKNKKKQGTYLVDFSRVVLSRLQILDSCNAYAKHEWRNTWTKTGTANQLPLDWLCLANEKSSKHERPLDRDGHLCQRQTVGGFFCFFPLVMLTHHRSRFYLRGTSLNWRRLSYGHRNVVTWVGFYLRDRSPFREFRNFLFITFSQIYVSTFLSLFYYF